MTKGNLEIKEDMDDSFVLRANNYSVYRIGNMQDLKDLKSLIDTVLGEEKKKIDDVYEFTEKMAEFVRKESDEAFERGVNVGVAKERHDRERRDLKVTAFPVGEVEICLSCNFDTVNCLCSQPLTEGKKKVYAEKVNDEWVFINFDRELVDNLISSLGEGYDSFVKPQESNKEKKWVIKDGIEFPPNNECFAHRIKDHNINDCIEMMKEPSKKPSTRIIEKFLENAKERQGFKSTNKITDKDWMTAIIDYLDELHNQRKI